MFIHWRSRETFHRGRLWSNRSSCDRCPAWQEPANSEFSLRLEPLFNDPHTSPFRLQMRSSVLSLQVAMNFPVAAMPIPMTSVRCTWEQQNFKLSILCSYLGEGDSYTKIPKRPIGLLCHFVHLWNCTSGKTVNCLVWIDWPQCNSALPSGQRKPWSLDST